MISPIDYKEHRITHPLLLTIIEAGTKGGELKEDTLGNSINVNSGSAKKIKGCEVTARYQEVTSINTDC